MSDVTFQLFGQAIDLNPQDLLDLGKADQDLKLVATELANLGSQLHALQDATLVSFALNSPAPSWTLPGSPATFTLTPTATFTIKLQSSGPLLQYYTDFAQSDPASQVSINPAPGKVYLIVEMNLGISGELSGSATVPTGIGVFKVSGQATAAASFDLRFFKAFDPATVAEDAIVQAIRSFTLPLHSVTATNMNSGDALYYEFDGNLAVGFGASYGISTSVAAYSLSGINNALNSIKQAANLTSPGATFNAQASLAVKANMSRKFHCVLEKTGTTATLHLFKGTDSDYTQTLTVNGGISNVSAPSITLDPAQLAAAIIAKLPSTAGSVVQLGLAQTATLQTAASAYIDQANKWLASLAQKVNSNGQISMSLQLEQANTNTRAFGWQFDTTQPNFPQIWNLAMSGDYAGAFEQGQGTVKLLEGSGFETTFKRNTQVKLSFFGLGGTFTTLNSYYGATSVVFRNGVFCFETNAGRMETVQSGDGKFSSTLYLDCLASNSTGSGSVGSVDLTLHGILTCTGQTDTLDKFGVMLHSIGINLGGDTGAEVLALGDRFRANAALRTSKGEGLLHLIFNMSALKRLAFDPYDPRTSKQSPRPHVLDRSNWNAFSNAFQTLPSTLQDALNASLQPAQYASFQSWEFFNCYANGLTTFDGSPNSQMTDRRRIGSSASTVPFAEALSNGVNDTLANPLALALQSALATYYGAGQQYMNLCDHAKTAATVATGSDIDWQALVALVKQIANRDIDAEYAPQVMLALLQSTQASALQIVTSMTDQNFGTGSVVIQVS